MGENFGILGEKIFVCGIELFISILAQESEHGNRFKHMVTEKYPDQAENKQSEQVCFFRHIANPCT